MPDVVVSEGILFQTGPKEDERNNAVACNGQTISLDSGYDRLYILAAARGGDTSGTFTAGGRSFSIGIQDYTERVADWGRESDV